MQKSPIARRCHEIRHEEFVKVPEAVKLKLAAEMLLQEIKGPLLHHGSTSLRLPPSASKAEFYAEVSKEAAHGRRGREVLLPVENPTHASRGH
jgi:hypothetical protein